MLSIFKRMHVILSAYERISLVQCLNESIDRLTEANKNLGDDFVEMRNRAVLAETELEKTRTINRDLGVKLALHKIA